MKNICRELRESMGYTSSQLGRKANMGQATINLIEAGSNVSEKSWMKLAKFFDISVGELKGEKKFDMDAWLEKVTAPTPEAEQDMDIQETEATPVVANTPTKLHDLNIKHLIKVTSAAANYYIEEGWILLDTMASPSNDTFYVLLGHERVHSSKDFESMRQKTKKPTSYWMSR